MARNSILNLSHKEVIAVSGGFAPSSREIALGIVAVGYGAITYFTQGMLARVFKGNKTKKVPAVISVICMTLIAYSALRPERPSIVDTEIGDQTE